MTVSSGSSHRGPVTLVVELEQPRAKVLSWSFSSERDAITVARALNRPRRWTLVRGVFQCANDALAAAQGPQVLVDQSPKATNEQSGVFPVDTASASQRSA